MSKIEIGDRVSFVGGKYRFTGKIDSLHLDCSEPWAGILVDGDNGTIACWTWRSLDKLTKLTKLDREPTGRTATEVQA